MKKLFLLTLLCPVLMGVALTSTSTNVVSDPVVENFVETGDVEVLPIDETGAESKFVGNKGAVVGGETTAYSETYYQLGESADGKNLIRFATAVKGNLKTLTYDLTYNGNTQQVNVERVYKAISVNGVTTYYGEEGMTTDETKSTYYWACFTIKFGSEAAVNTRFHAKLNILDNATNSFATKEQNTTLGALKYNYKYVNGVALDGKMDDAIYTDAVKTNKFTFSCTNANRATMDVYATRDDYGVYFYVDYFSSIDTSVDSSHTNWWTGENFEFRIVSQNGTLMNTNEYNTNIGNAAQYWASAFYGYSKSNFELDYVISPKLNETTNLYETKFELYASYDFMWADKNDPLGFNMGSNPGGNNWTQDSTFGNGNIYANKKITKDGIKQIDVLTASDCLEHDYNEPVVGVAPTCTTDGTQTRTCRWCNHVDTQVLAHQNAYNITNLVVDTPATCTTPGVGHGSCSECGLNHDDVIVSVDTYNHTAYDEALGRCTDCNNSEKAVTTFDRFTVGGWDAQFHYVAQNLTGDFNVTITYQHCADNARDNFWRGVLPVVRDATVSDGSVWVTRYDWWGWCDQRGSSNKLGDFHVSVEDGRGVVSRGESWHMGDNTLFGSILADCTIVLTVARNGNVISEDFVITHNSTGINYFYRARLLNVNPNTPVNVGFVAEYAKAEIQKVVYNR